MVGRLAAAGTGSDPQKIASAIQSLIDDATPSSMREALSQKGSVGGKLLALLLCILSSWPVSHLSKHAVSLVALICAAIVAIVQKLRLRYASRRAEARRIDGKQYDRLTLGRKGDPERTEVVFMGDARVGKTALRTALREFVSSDGHITAEDHADNEADVRRLVVIVWTAQLQEAMKAYATRWRSTARSMAGSQASTIVVCNMTDVIPCPMPEIDAMKGSGIPALAVSANKGINLSALWLLIERDILLAAPARPSRSPRAARREETTPAPMPAVKSVTISTTASEASFDTASDYAASDAPPPPPDPVCHAPITPAPSAVPPSGERVESRTEAHRPRASKLDAVDPAAARGGSWVWGDGNSAPTAPPPLPLRVSSESSSRSTSQCSIASTCNELVHSKGAWSTFSLSSPSPSSVVERVVT